MRKMAKNIKADDFGPELNRKLVANIGKTLYNFKDVKTVSIAVEFKDGSAISFERDDLSDDIDNYIKKDKEE